MIKDITIQAIGRDGVGKGFARRLRAKGMVPVTVYGDGKAATSVAVRASDLAALLRSETGHNTIFKLALPAEPEPALVIIKDWQVDPVKGLLLHADMMRLSMTSTTRVKVPIEFIGEPVGVKNQGGLLEIEMREVEVECLPANIPDHIRADVSNLKIGDHITAADLIYDGQKVKVLVDPHRVVAGVLAPRIAVEEAAPAAEAAAAPAEPEVIKKGKSEEKAQ
jgi:large subunit ribosomal protein L25